MKKQKEYECDCGKKLTFEKVWVVDEDMPSEYYMCKECYWRDMK